MRSVIFIAAALALFCTSAAGAASCGPYAKLALPDVYKDPVGLECVLERLRPNANASSPGERRQFDWAEIVLDVAWGRDEAAADKARQWLAQYPEASSTEKRYLYVMLASDERRRGDMDRARDYVARVVALPDLKATRGSALVYELHRLAPMKISGDASAVLQARKSFRHHTVVDIEVGGQTVPALIDTGNELGGSVNESLARELGFRFLSDEPIYEILMPAGFSLHYRRQRVFLAIAPEIRIGNVRLSDVPFIVEPGAERHIPLNIGLPVLSKIGRVAWLNRGREVRLGEAAPDPECLGGQGRLFFHAGVGLLAEDNDIAVPVQFDTGWRYPSAFENPLKFYFPDIRLKSIPVGQIKGMRFIQFLRMNFDHARMLFRNIAVTLGDARAPKPGIALWIGQDFVEDLEYISLDFQSMTYAASKNDDKIDACPPATQSPL